MLVQLYAKCLSLYYGATGRKVNFSSDAYLHPLAVIAPGTGKIIIGQGSKIHRGAMLHAYDGKIEIGKNVTVNPYAMLYGRGGLKIGNDVRIAAHAVIVASDHNFSDRTQPIVYQGETKKGIIIEDDVWIGAGAVILDGAHISRGCVIGANTVIKGKTEEFGVYVGAPGKKIKSR